MARKRRKCCRKKIGKFTITIKARPRGRQAQGGSACFAILDLTEGSRKIIEDVVIPFDEYSGISIIVDTTSEIIIKTMAASKLTNYKIHTDVNSPIQYLRDIEKNPISE